MIKKIDSNKWRDILSEINKEVTDVSFSTWIEPSFPLGIDENTGEFLICCENEMGVNVVKMRYLPVFEKAISNVLKDNYKLSVSLGKKDKSLPSGPATILPSGAEKGNINIHYENNQGDEYVLNPRYNFENFVVGANNNYAHAVSLAVAEAPSKTYNPLFIYGGSGLGKTHLMHAIGHKVLTKFPEKKVLYVSSEMFTNELIQAIGDKRDVEKTNSFKQKYRSVDVLLIDDIQFLEGKNATQLEFFHTFNSLHALNKQIVICSDRHPSKLTDLDERLRTRFSWEMVADVQPPDYETRVAILRNKAKTDNIPFDEDLIDVIDLIAEKIKFNVRELESALTRVRSLSIFKNEKITVKFAKENLTDIFSVRDIDISCETIKKAVCNLYNIKIIDIESKKRTKEISFPRQIAMYLCRELTDLSFPKIGDSFGGRDHTTVLHAYNRISKEIKINPSLADDIKSLKDEIS